VIYVAAVAALRPGAPDLEWVDARVSLGARVADRVPVVLECEAPGDDVRLLDALGAHPLVAHLEIVAATFDPDPESTP